MELSLLEFGLVATAALVIAADEAVGRAESLREKLPRLAGLWRFLPAAMLAIATALYGIRQWTEPPPLTATSERSPYYWEPLSSAEGAKLRASVTPLAPQHIVIVCNADDCGDLARSTRDAFRLAGWQVDEGPNQFLGADPGLTLAVYEPQLASLAGIIENATGGRLSVQKYRGGFPLNDKYTHVVLLIGSKP